MKAAQAADAKAVVADSNAKTASHLAMQIAATDAQKKNARDKMQLAEIHRAAAAAANATAAAAAVTAIAKGKKKKVTKNHALWPMHRPTRSFLVGSYSNSTKYLEQILDSTNLKRHDHENKQERRRDFETQRQRELAIAELAVHIGDSVMTKLRLETQHTSAAYVEQRDGPSRALDYACLHSNPATTRLTMHADTFIFVNTLLSRRHTKKYNLRLVEGHLVNTCLRCMHSEDIHSDTS